MPSLAKLLIGLAGALLLGWISHGPLGQGEAFMAALEARTGAAVREAELPGVAVRFSRDPMTREAILSGTVNDFQREGMGLLPGLDDRVRAVPGVSGLRWEETDCCAAEE